MAVAETSSEALKTMPLGAQHEERRGGARRQVSCVLWMVGHESSTILRCRCDNAGDEGLHLLAPLGYGIAEGQRYELRSLEPGVRPFLGDDGPSSRWARVVRTELLLHSGRDQLGLGVTLEAGPTHC